jgi:hypothetical protein
VAAADVQAVFPDAPPRAGLYESFYLRAVHPERPLGVWIRYTVHKPPGAGGTARGRAAAGWAAAGRTAGGRAAGGPGPIPRGSVWCTVFDGAERRPLMYKLTTEELSVPADGWIAVGESQLGPARAEGACGEARWSLRFASGEPELRHLPRALLYRTPLPRTKLTSPLPAARFEGALVLASPPRPHSPADSPRTLGSPSPGPSTALSSRTIQLDGWHGMVGHNWGAEHAERWIWLHGIGFAEDPEAWLDVAIGRVRVAGRTTPWAAAGALHIDGERHRLGGLGARGLLVAERPERCALSLPGAGGLVVEAHVHAPRAALAGWRYANPDDRSELGQHGVSNCSIAALTLTVRRPGRPARTLRTAHGAAYELGARERP